MADHDRFFVLTGGPGAGKTTLIEALADRGHATVPEAGRGVIRDQAAIDGPALPWKDPARFAEAMLGWELRSYAAARGRRGPVFFDRGIPDVAGYLALTGSPVPPHVTRAVERFPYNRTVFVLPFWPEIYRQDEERLQSPAEALRTFETITAVYRELGYKLVDVPKARIGERAAFVLDQVGRRLADAANAPYPVYARRPSH